MFRSNSPREAALEILRRAERGEFADALLDRARPSFTPLDNAFLLELVYGTLRNRAYLDHALNLFSERPVQKTDAWTRNILRLGAYQMLFLDRVPVSAAVDASTELAKRFGKKPGYVNGLLRSLDRNRGGIHPPSREDPVRYLSVLYSHPAWLVRRWVDRYGAETTEAVLRADNRPAPLFVRANTLKVTREDLKASLEAEGAEVKETAYAPAGLIIVSSPGIRNLSAYAKGWFMVQDEAAQLVSLILGPRPGETVLDACAAPGGKATHLAELMQDRGSLVALEADAGRIGKIAENSTRLGLSIITPVRGDAARCRKGAFDRILIDAPCSGLGVLRRHPDGRWTKEERTVLEHRALQKNILDNCARLLKPGGVLVYATCTTEPEENEEVIKDFLAKHPEFALDDPRPHLPASAGKLVDEKGFFRTFPVAPEMDGFFGARLLRKKGP